MTWDLTGDNRTVAKGQLRAVLRRRADARSSRRAVPGVQDFVTYFVVDGDVNDLEEIGRSVLSVPYKVADDIKHPRVDEITLGFERAITAGMRLSVTGIWRDNKDFVNSVNPLARWSTVTVTNQLTNSPIQLYRWDNRTQTDVGSNNIIQNVEGFQYLDPGGNVIGVADPFRKYRALMTVLSKRFSNRWQAQFSYVYSKVTGNVDNIGGQQVSTRQFETPNYALVNADGTPDQRPAARVQAARLRTMIPKIETSVNGYFRTLSGRTYAPFQQYSNAELNMPTAYRRPYLEPLGSRRLDTASLLDLRIEKIVQIRRRSGRDLLRYRERHEFIRYHQRAHESPGTDVSTQTGTVTLPFETAGALAAPRQMRIGLRWSF